MKMAWKEDPDKTSSYPFFEAGVRLRLEIEKELRRKRELQDK